MKKRTCTFSYLMVWMLLFVTLMGHPQSIAAAKSTGYITVDPTTQNGLRGCLFTGSNDITFFVAGLPCLHGVYDVTWISGISIHPTDPRIVADQDGLVTEFSERALQVSTVIWMDGQRDALVLAPSNEFSEWIATIQAGKLHFPRTLLCNPNPCSDHWPFPDLYPPTFPWPKGIMTIGEHHNAALDYFYKNEPPLEMREDHNISLNEYKRLLKATTIYTIENIHQGDVDVDVANAIKTLEATGLIVQDGVDAYVITNFEEVAARQVDYLLKQNKISQQLADELTKINKMAHTATDDKQIIEYVTNDFVNQGWDERDAVSVAVYEDIFLNSAIYWEKFGSSNQSDHQNFKKSGAVNIADALGWLVGLWHSGSFKDATSLGTAFSAVMAAFLEKIHPIPPQVNAFIVASPATGLYIPITAFTASENRK